MGGMREPTHSMRASPFLQPCFPRTQNAPDTRGQGSMETSFLRCRAGRRLSGNDLRANRAYPAIQRCRLRTRETGSLRGTGARCLLRQLHPGHPAALLKSVLRKWSQKETRGRVPRPPVESSDSWVFHTTGVLSGGCQKAEFLSLMPPGKPFSIFCSLVVSARQTVLIFAL